MLSKVECYMIDLLQTSTLVTSLLAIMITATDMYVFVAGKGELPAQLWLLTGVIFGFFFGAKVQNTQVLTARALTLGRRSGEVNEEEKKE
jgi:uncharacterized integral membrane protein